MVDKRLYGLMLGLVVVFSVVAMAENASAGLLDDVVGFFESLFGSEGEQTIEDVSGVSPANAVPASSDDEFYSDTLLGDYWESPYPESDYYNQIVDIGSVRADNSPKPFYVMAPNRLNLDFSKGYEISSEIRLPTWPIIAKGRDNFLVGFRTWPPAQNLQYSNGLEVYGKYFDYSGNVRNSSVFIAPTARYNNPFNKTQKGELAQYLDVSGSDVGYLMTYYLDNRSTPEIGASGIYANIRDSRGNVLVPDFLVYSGFLLSGTSDYRYYLKGIISDNGNLVFAWANPLDQKIYMKVYSYNGESVRLVRDSFTAPLGTIAGRFDIDADSNGNFVLAQAVINSSYTLSKGLLVSSYSSSGELKRSFWPLAGSETLYSIKIVKVSVDSWGNYSVIWDNNYGYYFVPRNLPPIYGSTVYFPDRVYFMRFSSDNQVKKAPVQLPFNVGADYVAGLDADLNDEGYILFGLTVDRDYGPGKIYYNFVTPDGLIAYEGFALLADYRKIYLTEPHAETVSVQFDDSGAFLAWDVYYLNSFVISNYPNGPVARAMDRFIAGKYVPISGFNNVPKPDLVYPPSGTQEPSEPEFNADVNRDGLIDFADVNIVAFYLDKRCNVGDDVCAKADINGDGQVDSADMSLIASRVER